MNILSLFKGRKHYKALEIPASLERFEVILSGSGGQGMILAGRILAEAASIYDHKEAIMAKSYGPEARGGASRAEVIISSSPIDYPRVTRADALLAMTQESLDGYGKFLDANGILIVDETFVKKIPTNFKNVFKAPFNTTAMKFFDTPIVVNIIALSCLVSITKVVSREALLHAALARFPKKLLVPDRIAADIGFKIARDSGFTWKKKG